MKWQATVSGETAISMAIRRTRSACCACVISPCSRQPSDGRMTQNRTPLFGPTCLGAQT